MNVRNFDNPPPIWVALLFQDGPAKGMMARLPAAMRVGDHYIFTVPDHGRVCYVATTTAVPIGNDPLRLSQSLKQETNIDRAGKFMP